MPQKKVTKFSYVGILRNTKKKKRKDLSLFQSFKREFIINREREREKVPNKLETISVEIFLFYTNKYVSNMYISEIGR